ncbi:MAG: hypothetical protein ACOY4K_06120 [Pseudomonadota bacterium]
MISELAIPLEPAEQVLLERIAFSVDALRAPGRFQANGDAVVQLVQTLYARGAIPKHRLSFFQDPEWNPSGRGVSIQQYFERNGTSGEAILRHGNFLTYLRYFLFGPELPAAIYKPFHKAVEECGMITSGDIKPLSDLARRLARTHGYSYSSADVFFQLALECGMDPDDAGYVRRSVQQIRS